MSKNVLITGSSKGIGRSIAKILAQNNYNVYLCAKIAVCRKDNNNRTTNCSQQCYFGNFMNSFFYFTKGQRRGIILFIIIVAAVIFYRWII